MPTQDDIEQQLQLLAAHRATLHHWLRQAAQHGGIDLAPPTTGNGIAEARREIASIKVALRDWEVAVADHPDDEAIIVQSTTVTAERARRRSGPIFISRDRIPYLSLAIIVTLAVALIVVIALRSAIEKPSTVDIIKVRYHSR